MDIPQLIGILRPGLADSTCERGRVGAALLDPSGAVVFTAGAKPLPTEPACLSFCDFRDRCRHSVHAEMYCLRHLAERGITDTAGWTIAVSSAPCYRCAQLIVMSGVRHVIHLKPYREPAGLEILARAGIDVQYLGPWPV